MYFEIKRPTCLNFKTKANLKRHEVIELLKEINFEPQCKRQFGLDSYTFSTNLLACATSVCFASYDFWKRHLFGHFCVCVCTEKTSSRFLVNRFSEPLSRLLPPLYVYNAYLSRFIFA